MTLGVAELIEMASSFYTLFPGDIISTGTPEGVSPIVPGDVIVATIEKIGSMEVKVRAAEAHSSDDGKRGQTALSTPTLAHEARGLEAGTE
jgi:hypothetical protein